MNGKLKSLLIPFLDRLYNYYQRKKKAQAKERIGTLLNSCQSAGKGVRLNGNNHVFSEPKKMVLGNNVHIGSNAFFKSEGGLIIGDNTHISRNVIIYTVNHNYEGIALPYDNTTIYKPVTIGENVWIGMNVSIVPGITIGDGAIIGLGTVVNRNIEPFEIVGSPKTEELKYRDKEHYSGLINSKSYGGKSGKLIPKDEIESFFPTYKANKEKSIVFVLGTGRSGTVSITNILNQHPNCKAFHEDIRQLIRLSTDLAYCENEDYIYKELNSIFESKVWNASENQIIIHSDQRLWNLIPFLSKYFINSKFIHLEREPISCIKSMVLRDWYQTNEYPDYSELDWAKYRLQGDLVDKISTIEWLKMSNIEKCTWYYFHINNHISIQLKQLPDSRTMYLKLEDLDSNLVDMLEFIDVSKLKLTVVKSNTIQKKDQSKIENIDEVHLLAEIKKAQEVYKTL